MKKHSFPVLVLLCFLIGCKRPAVEPPSESVATGEETPESIFSQITVPESETDPESEAQTPVSYKSAIFQDDSLAILPLELDLANHPVSIQSLGNSLLIAEALKTKGDDAVTECSIQLSVYDPAADRTLYSVNASLPINDTLSVKVLPDDQVAVHSSTNQEIIFFDSTLSEQSRIVFPAFDLPDTDSSNCRLLLAPDYSAGYCVDDSGHNLYRIGTDQTVTLLYSSRGTLSLDNVLFKGECLSVHRADNKSTYFIRCSDGEVIHRTNGLLYLESSGYEYIARNLFSDGSGVILSGNIQSPRFIEIMQLIDGHAWSQTVINWANSILTNFVDALHTLCCYDLNQKSIRARNDLTAWLHSDEEAQGISSFGSCMLDDARCAYLIYDCNTEQSYLAVWDYTREPPAEDFYEEFHFLGSYDSYIPSEPLSLPALPPEYDEVQAFADQLEALYGVEIRIAEECSSFSPDDYAFDYLTDIERIQFCLEVLQSCLSVYPENFFSQLKGPVYSNGLCIGICGTIYGAEYSSLASASGISNYSSMQKTQYILMDGLIGMFPSVFHHEMSHIIENHIQTLTYDSTSPDAFSDDVWCGMNPADFHYYQDYSQYDSMDEQYTTPGNWPDELYSQMYFLDPYAKTFSTEDRATIFAESAAYGDLEYSDLRNASAIHRKLEYICRYIRYHFNTEDWPETTIWERGL